MPRSTATLIGFTAVLLWALLALLTVATAPIPPLQLNAICFGTGGIIGLIWTARTGGFSALRQVPWYVYVGGTVGLFGYHFLYFSALRNAPAAEAGLIAYLWPLLIVLFSGLLPGETLRPQHIIGAFIGFAGVALVILGDSDGFDPAFFKGYAMAFGCALTWSIYSVLSRRWGNVPTQSVAIFCIFTALISALAHFIFETTVWPATALGWGATVALGLGPVGLAFYVWDIGVKKGDIQLLGIGSFAAPLLSTFVLIGAGITAPRWPLLLAALLIAGGALIAARAGAANKSDQT
ncbi:MAG: aromatic amino acid exporter YddG [Paracoccaceae bacterium]